MRLRPRTLAWFLTAIWLVWISALQASLQVSFGQHLPLPLPDLVTILLVCLATLFSRRALLPLALVATLARKSFSIDPPLAILFASLCIVALAGALRSVVELRGATWRSIFAGLCATLFPLWLALARQARGIGEVDLAWGNQLASLAVTLLLAFFFGTLFVRLPGLAPLKRERWST